MHVTPGALPRPGRWTAALVATTLAVGLAGCGGDDDEPTTTATTATAATTTEAPTTTAVSEAEKREAFKTAYAAQRTSLNAVTQRLGTALQTADEKTNAQFADELSAVRRDFAAGITELKKLDPPTDLASDFETATRTADLLVSDIGGIVSGARAGDAEATRRASQALASRIPTLQTATKAIVSGLGLPPSEDAGSGTTTGSTSR